MSKVKLDRNLFEVMEKIKKEGKKKETLKKLLKAYVFGYEQEVEVEVDKNKNAVVVEYAIWGEEGRYDVLIKKEYSEDESFKKTLTFEEVLNKFPKLWPFEQNNK